MLQATVHTAVAYKGRVRNGNGGMVECGSGVVRQVYRSAHWVSEWWRSWWWRSWWWSEVVVVEVVVVEVVMVEVVVVASSGGHNCHGSWSVQRCQCTAAVHKGVRGGGSTVEGSSSSSV